MPTIHEVAKEAGVSASTVSRSFTDSTLLTDATRERVLEVARRLDYRPPHARLTTRSARGTTTRPAPERRTIAFQFFAPSETATVHTDAFYAPMLAGAQAEALSQGMPLMIHTTTRSGLSHDLSKQSREQAVAGMLLVGTADPEILTDFLEHVPQIVLVDNRDPSQRHDCVLSDGIGGAASATGYLFSLGHRRVAFVMSDPQTATFQDRLTGYMAAHFRAGMTAERRQIIEAATDAAFVSEVTTLLTGEAQNRPTALVAANDPHAYRLIQICHHLGIRVPEDISIIGFDDDQFSALATPALTTMRVDTEYLGRLAVRRLLTRLQEKSPESGVPTPKEPSINIEVPVSLIVRGSCAPPRLSHV